MATAAGNGVQVVQRVSSILKVLRGEPEGLSLGQIADRVGLARSTVHRLVSALERERLVVAASATRGYRLGPFMATLATAAAQDVTFAIQPFLKSLANELNETVDLAVLEHDHTLCVDQVAAPEQRLRAASAVGSLAPAHCTADGKALLAALPDGEVERRLTPVLERMTPRTITTRGALLEELERVRAEGIAFDREEHTIGICAVAVAVEAPAGHLAAITIPLPAQRFYGNEGRLVEALFGATRAVVQGLGPA